MAPNEPVEVELKLLLPAHAGTALKRHPALQAPCATAPETGQEHTVYFDTPLLSLAGKGLSLRVRRCGAARVPSCLKMLTRSRYDLADDAAQPDQIAHGFMIGVRHPDGRQLSSPMKTGEHDRVANLFSPDRCLRRNLRRRHHVAPMAETCELAMNAVAATVRPHNKMPAACRDAEDGRTAC